MGQGSIVYVVDDDASVRETIECLVRSVGLTAISFASGREFLERLPTDAPACVVLDVYLRDVSGLELQRELAYVEPSLPVIFITGHGDISMSVQAIKAGAVGFLSKPFRAQDLLEAIRDALEGARVSRHERASLSKLQDQYQLLTPRERQVLALVVAGMLNKQIGSQLGITEGTVKIHRGQVMQKMRAQSLVDLVRASARLGIGTSLP